MADHREDLLRACTVRVIGGPAPGTGFLVAPGMVLTCVHVIGGNTDLRVRWERDDQPVHEVPVVGLVAVLEDRGRPIPALDRDYPDVAVLKVDGIDGHPCVGVDQDWPSLEDSFQVFGYPQEGGAVLLTPARLTYRGKHGTEPTIYLDLASDTIKPGMSGAAVLNLRSSGVCGVVVASKHPAHPDGALVVPWSAITADLGEVLAANRVFHLQDHRWEQAAASLRQRLRFRLPRVDAYFTGRVVLLSRLDAALNNGRAGVITQTLSGLGGVGKTQLAAAFVAAYQDDFDIVAWVRAEDGGTAELAELAVALGLPVAGRTPPQRADDALLYLANTDRRWLLVLDNVPGPEALTGLPTSGQGRVLVTSRRRGGYATFGGELNVDVLDISEAVQYLLRRAGRPEQEVGGALAVALALGCLPLALAHAGAYCQGRFGISFDYYLELLEDLPARELLDRQPYKFYAMAVASTWNISIAAAVGRAPLARRALQMAAFLAPDAIPRSFFLALGEMAGHAQVINALVALDSYSLITVDGNRVSVHRLVQRVIREGLDRGEQEDAATCALSAVHDAMPGDPRLPATWPQWQELVPHAVALASSEVVADIDAAQLMTVLNAMCLFLLSAGSSRQAIDLATRAVSISTAHLGADHLYTLTARGALASLYRLAGLTGDAITAGQQVAVDFERVLGPDHSDTLVALANLAIAYGSAGHNSEARDLLERVIADSDRVRGPDHPDTLTARTNLALSYWFEGRTREAIALQERVVADSERVRGPDHPHSLAARAGLALSYRDADRNRDAIALLEQVVASSERVLGPEHPDTLSARHNLAVSYGEAERISEALDLLEPVVADSERVLGPGHPDTLSARGDLASMHHLAGQTDEAVALEERVVTDSERILGSKHPDTLKARLNLATIYDSAGYTDRALPLLEQVAADSERILGPEHPNTIVAQGNLEEMKAAKHNEKPLRS